MTGERTFLPEVGDDLPAGPRPMIAVIDALPGHAGELRAAVRTLAAAVRREPGCLTFIPYQQVGAPGRFHLYEVYADVAAFRDHLRTDHVRRFFGALAAHSTAGAQNLAQLAELDVAQAPGANERM